MLYGIRRRPSYDVVLAGLFESTLVLHLREVT